MGHGQQLQLNHKQKCVRRSKKMTTTVTIVFKVQSNRVASATERRLNENLRM